MCGCCLRGAPTRAAWRLYRLVFLWLQRILPVPSALPASRTPHPVYPRLALGLLCVRVTDTYIACGTCACASNPSNQPLANSIKRRTLKKSSESEKSESGSDSSGICGILYPAELHMRTLRVQVLPHTTVNQRGCSLLLACPFRRRGRSCSRSWLRQFTALICVAAPRYTPVHYLPLPTPGILPPTLHGGMEIVCPDLRHAPSVVYGLNIPT